MMYFKPLLVVLLFIEACVCGPRRPNNATTPSGSPTNQTENETEVPSIVATKDKVQLTVYYETHCPASIRFITHPLQRAMLKLGSHIDLQLMPYGNAYTTRVANTTDSYTFDCQHGKIECHGNTVHACAIHVLQNSTKAVLVNSCLMENFYYYTDDEIRECAAPENATLNSTRINDILNCVHGTLGTTLLKKNGDATWAEGALYVPHLTFSGSSKYEWQARSNLIRTICDMLNPQPQECTIEVDKTE